MAHSTFHSSDRPAWACRLPASSPCHSYSGRREMAQLLLLISVCLFVCQRSTATTWLGLPIRRRATASVCSVIHRRTRRENGVLTILVEVKVREGARWRCPSFQFSTPLYKGLSLPQKHLHSENETRLKLNSRGLGGLADRFPPVMLGL